MTGLVRSGGEFWTAENQGVRVRGEFTAEVGQNAEVTPQAGLTAGLPVAGPRPRPAFKPGDMAGAVAAHAAASVARFRPITIFGQLDTGELVTLLDAANYGGAGLAPQRVAPVAVFGAHVSQDRVYSTVRFRIDHPYRLGHLSNGESSVVEDDGSILSVEAATDGNWLVYASSAPATLRQLDIRVVSSCPALVRLAQYPDHDLVTRDTQIRVDPDGPWLTVHGPAFCAEPVNDRLDTLLSREELTVERLAKWIALNDRLDGLAWAVARPPEGALQIQAQVLTSLVEGLHRRRSPQYEQSKFPDATGGALDRVKQAARRAAVAKAETEQNLNPQKIRNAVIAAVAHLEDVDYSERAGIVVAEVCAAVPEIAESVADLPKLLTTVRNDFAHQLPQDDAKDPIEVRFRRWNVVCKVTPWLLRTLLLLHVGVEPRVLRQKYLENKRFAFYRENVAQVVRELG